MYFWLAFLGAVILTVVYHSPLLVSLRRRGVLIATPFSFLAILLFVLAIKYYRTVLPEGYKLEGYNLIEVLIIIMAIIGSLGIFAHADLDSRKAKDQGLKVDRERKRNA